MTLSIIGLMIAAALGVWLFQRAWGLLMFSLIALYGLQAGAILPTATLLLVVGVWWIVAQDVSPGDRRVLLLLALSAAILILAVERSPIPLAQIGLVGVGAYSAGAILPRTDEAARRKMALLFLGVIVALLVILKLPALQPVIPLAIDWQWVGFSYIAFRLMHVLLDYRSGKLGSVTLRDFALYVIFFPSIPAGPIDRIEHFARELAEPRRLDASRVVDGLLRIGTGLFKKFILADSLAYIALSPQLVSQARPGLSLWIMLYAYAFRLYFDFSGYTDIAIGIGILAGIKLPENFAAPYAKRNITAFWNSWHITLATWFRNYFFTPFSRTLMSGPLRTRRLLVIFLAQVSTMILIGLWHGIAINFVLWGLWHGLGLWFHRWLTEHTLDWDAYVAERPRLARTIHGLSILATFHFVALGWVFFALPDLSLIGKAFAGLAGLNG